MDGQHGRPGYVKWHLEFSAEIRRRLEVFEIVVRPARPVPLPKG
jgi:hypothetical protein